MLRQRALLSGQTQICDDEFLKVSSSYDYSKYLFGIFENKKRRTIFSYFVRLQQNRNATDITISVVSSGGHLGTSLKIAPYIYRNATVFKLRLMTKWDDWCQNILLHAALTHFPNCALMAWQRSASYFRTKKKYSNICLFPLVISRLSSHFWSAFDMVPLLQWWIF